MTLQDELLAVLNQIPAAIEKAFTEAMVLRHPGHGSQKVHGRRGGGGVQAETKPKSGQKEGTPANPSGNKAAVGVHVKKLAGDKAAAAGYLAEIDAVDKTFGGGVSRLLEKHPLDSIKVGTDTASMGMAAAQGSYNPHSQKLTVKPQSKVGEPFMKEEGSTFSVIHGQKTDEKQDMLNATFVHELGHHVAFTVIRNSSQGQQEVYKKVIIDSFQKDGKKVSGYASTHPHEYFAESFTAYHFAPKSLSPTAKKMVEDVMSRAGELS